MARGKGLILQGYEFPSSLTPQEHHGGNPLPFVKDLFRYISLSWSILVLHLLVIHAHT